MLTVQAVLFDFDGVLAKTLEDNCRAWEHAFAKIPIPFDPRIFLLAEGRKSAEYLAGVLSQHEKSHSLIDSLIADKNAYYEKFSTFSLYDGASELIGFCKSRMLKTGIVSGGSKARLFRNASQSVLSSVDIVVTGDDVHKGKPNPEAYLKAAKLLSLSPATCLVVENAPLGVAAAKNAGMPCVGVCSTLGAEDLIEADVVVASLSEVKAYLESNLPAHSE